MAAETDALLEDLVSRIHRELGDGLVAVYLYGSCVSGGFDPGVSDLDLVAVTAADAGDLDLAGLDRVHHDIVGREPEWSDRLEIVYVGREALRSFRTSAGPLAVISPGEPFHLRHDRLTDWVQNWYLVRETGVTLYGPLAATIVPAVEWSEFVAATARYAGEISTRNLADATARTLAYEVLTMCRAFMTVKTQTNPSKQEAAAWAREQLPDWAWLIEAAVRCRLSRGTVGFDDDGSRAAAAEFIEVIATRVGDRS
jgi:predicted nucleotidyltransferase